MAYGSPTFDKDKTLALLKSLGITEVLLEFAGGNDEGGVESEKYKTADGEVTIPRVYADRNWGAPNDEELVKVIWEGSTKRLATEEEINLAAKYEEVRDMCEAPIYDRYYTFAGEFYVTGTLHIDVAKGTVKMEVSEGQMTYEEHETSF